MTQSSAIDKTVFGHLPDGRVAHVFQLTNRAGMTATISNFGGVITRLTAPDREGLFADVVLGFDELAPYVNASPYFGALIGRYANRLCCGRFSLDGCSHQVSVNDGVNHLHGGHKGFDKVLWQADTARDGDDLVLKLSYLSVAGEEGYPGNLQVAVSYRLTPTNSLITEFMATADAPTPVNMTQHSYFNLAGCGDILQHQLQLHASQLTPVSEGLIPTGDVVRVEASPFDFRHFTAIGARINNPHEQLQLAGGYDHNFVLDKPSPGAFALAASVREPVSGRQLRVATSEPALQFYSGNFLDGSLFGKGRRYNVRSGFCLEPQHYPDSPNQAHFPSTILRPGERYNSKTSFEFSTF